MKRALAAVVFAASVAFAGAAAVAQMQMQPGQPTGDAMSMDMMRKMMDDMMPKAGDSPAVADYKRVHMKMMMAMHTPITGKADLDFVRGMIPHHQGAIDMAEVVLKHGADAEVKKLAQEIIKAQKAEIGEMQKIEKRLAN